MTTHLREKIPSRIRTVMCEKGMSQNRLAPKINVSQGTLSKWLRGDVEMTLSAVDRITEALDVTVSELLGEADV